VSLGRGRDGIDARTRTKQNAPTGAGAFAKIVSLGTRWRPVGLVALAAATTTTEAAASAAATTAAAGAVFTRTRFVHREGAALHGLAVEEADRLLAFFGRGHGDEGKATAPARELILHEGDFGDGAGFGEGILKVDFSGIEGQIADVEFAGHDVSF